jgi:protein-disulfide isomerase
MPTKSTRRSTEKESVSESHSQSHAPTYSSHSDSPYSLSSVVRFINNNFLLVVMGTGLFVVGFVFGSMWTENKTLKAGGLGAGTPQAAVQQQAAPAEAQPLSDADWKEIQKDPVMIIGDKNAKLTMVEFTDYQCPFCEKYYTDTHKQLVEKYVKTGKMKIVMRDQALSFHPNANSAAQLVRCSVEQGKGVEMHDQLFSNQAAWVQLTGDALNAKYAELAKAAGADGAKAVECVKSGKHKAKVDADGQLGTRVGAGGTPTFFFEGKPLVGAQPFTAFDTMIAEKSGDQPGLPNSGKAN